MNRCCCALKPGSLLRKVLVALAVVVVILIVGLIIFLTRFDSIARKGIEKSLTWALQVPVTVDRVHVSVLNGEAEIRGLVIGNPEGYQTPQAFSVETAAARIDLRSFRTDEPIIHEIVIEAPAITLEQGLQESNLSRLAKNAGRFSGGKEPQDADPVATQETETPEVGQKVKIERLVLNDARVEVSAPVLKGQTVPIPLPPITLTDLGGQKDAPATAEAMSRVFLAILEGAARSGKGALPPETIQSLQGSLDRVRAIRTQWEKSGKQLGQELRKTHDGVGGLLKGLIPKTQEAETK